jgi:hypothetical protein
MKTNMDFQKGNRRLKHTTEFTDYIFAGEDLIIPIK